MKKIFMLLAAMMLATNGDASAFKIAAIPDTQRMTQYYPSYFKNEMKWIRDNVSSENIAFLTHLGDVVDDDTSTQWSNADAAMDYIDQAGIPYSICIGNHDYDTKGPSYVPPRDVGTTKFTNYFGEVRFSGYSWYKGTGPHGLCTYQIFSAGGRDWLHINIEYMADDEELLWAQRVLDSHPDLPAILSTHAFLNEYSDLTNTDSTQGLMANGGIGQWSKFVAHNDQIFMVLNGHYFRKNPNDGVAHMTVTNDYGNDVFLQCINFQEVDDDDHFRLLEFDLANNVIHATTYSPHNNSYLTDSENQFTLSINFNNRFNFTPREDVVTLQAANITVVENNTDNTSGSVTASIPTGQSTSAFSIVPDGTTHILAPGVTNVINSSNGDYFVKVGSRSEDDALNGIMIACAAENGRTNLGDSAETYHLAQATTDSKGDYFIATADAVGGSEKDVNVSAAYFPFSGGWESGRLLSISNGSPTWAFVGSENIALGDNLTQLPQGAISGSDTNKAGGGTWGTSDADRGVWNLSLSGVDSENDGILLACGGKNENNFAAASAWDASSGRSGWQICSVGSGSSSTECDPVNFVYVPFTTKNIVAGRIEGDADVRAGTGGFTTTWVTNGTIRLDIAGRTPADGTLIVTTELEWYNSDDFTTYEPVGDHWIIETRDLPGATLANVGSCQFTFLFIPFENTPFRPGPPANFNYNVVWGGGTGSWTDTNNWAASEALDWWGIPGWLSGNPKNRGNSTLPDWHEGKVYINSGTAQITASSQLDGEIPHLQLGHNEGSSTLEIAADLTVRDRVYIGYQSRAVDVATINQTAGDVVLGTVAGSRTYFARGLGKSTYNLSGGTLETKGDWDQFGNNVDDADDGASIFTFNQTGGAYTDTGANELVLADKAPSIAHVKIGGGVFRANASNGIRIGNNGTATLDLYGTGAFETTSGTCAIGYYAPSHGTLNLSNETFTASGNLYVGRSGTGTINLVGGSLISKYCPLGVYTGSQGTINLDSGSMDMTATEFYIGRSGTGEFNQTGGSFETSGRVSLGRYNDGVGTLNISGGTFTMHGSDFFAGYTNNTVGIVNQSGGTVDLTRLILGQETGTSGRYSISGGSLVSQNYITGRNGIRLFEVVGSGATSITTHRVYFWDDHFRAKLDASGSTLIQSSAGNGYDGKIDLRKCLFELDTLPSFDGQPGDVYDIMWSSADIIVDQAGYTDRDMVFSNLSSETFEWRVVDKNGGKMLQVYIPDTPVVNYEYWLRDYPTLGTATNMADDPDGDALDNLGEYALGGNPDDPQSQGYLPQSALQETSGSNYVEYVYAKRKDSVERGLAYSLEQTTNLVSGVWSNASAAVVGTGSLDADFDTVTNHVSTTGQDQEFIHLRVEYQ